MSDEKPPPPDVGCGMPLILLWAIQGLLESKDPEDVEVGRKILVESLPLLKKPAKEDG